jgi:hypothetical protein
VVTAEGIGGELRVGYRVASALRHWSMRPDPEPNPDEVCTVAVEWAFQDPFWSTQRPQTLHLKVGAREWRWDQVEVGGNHITVRGKPQEGVFHGKAQ